jgi:hypothetical protein
MFASAFTAVRRTARTIARASGVCPNAMTTTITTITSTEGVTMTDAPSG